MQNFLATSIASRKQHHIQKREEAIRQILANEIPKGFNASSLNSFASFVAGKLGVTANSLVRPGSKYRPLIAEAFENQKYGNSDINEKSNNASVLRSIIHRNEITISNQRNEIQILRNIINNSIDPQSHNNHSSNNYHAEFDATCRALRDLLAHSNTLGIFLVDNAIVDKGNESLGLEPEVIVSGSDLSHFVKWNNG